MRENKRYIVADGLLIGHDKIDSQHVELFNRLNSVLDAAEQGRSVMEVRKFILFLADYVREHLELEERIMNELDYPDKQKHFKEHDFFRESYRSIVDDFSNDRITYEELIQSLQIRIGDWFMNHIKKTDLQLARFIAEKQ